MKKNLELTCLLAALIMLTTFGQASVFASPPPQPQEEAPTAEEPPILPELELFWAKSEPQQNLSVCPDLCPQGMTGQEWILCCPEGEICDQGVQNPCTVLRVSPTYFCAECYFDLN